MGAHVEREIVAGVPSQCAPVGRTAQERHCRYRVESLVDIVLPEGVKRELFIDFERRVGKHPVVVPCAAVEVVFAAGQAYCRLETVTHRHREGNACRGNITHAGVGCVATCTSEITASYTCDYAARRPVAAVGIGVIGEAGQGRAIVHARRLLIDGKRVGEIAQVVAQVKFEAQSWVVPAM